MIFSYFLKKFYAIFFAFFFGLLFIFASTNLFLRLPNIATIYTIPVIFWTMIPLTSLFALPIATCIAIQSVIGDLIIHDNQITFFYFSQNARKALYKAVLFFSLSITVFYIPLVFKWAPQSYRNGKKILITLAQDQLNQLPPLKLHTPFPGVSLYFNGKKSTYFDTIFLAFTKHNKHYFFSAQRGVFDKQVFLLQNGSVCSQNKNKFYHALFDNAQIDLNKLVFKHDINDDKNLETHDKHDIKEIQETRTKFLTWSTLVAHKDKNIRFFIELHKRFSQVVWQFLLPFLALLFLFIFKRKRNNMIQSVLFASGAFLATYMLFALATFLSFMPILALILFYGPPILVTGLFCFYMRKAL